MIGILITIPNSTENVNVLLINFNDGG